MSWLHKLLCNKFFSRSNPKQRVQNEPEVRRRMKSGYIVNWFTSLFMLGLVLCVKTLNKRSAAE